MQNDQPNNENGKASRDVLSTAAMAVAAVASLAGFGMVFSQWWGNSISDPQEILRIASQEFVAGHPVVAGDLAETVVFDLDPELDDGEPDLPAETEADAVPADPANDPVSQAAVEANEEKERWIGLRNFLVGAGKFARAKEEEDTRDHRQLLIDAVVPLQQSAVGGFPPGRVTQGNRILGEILFELGEHEKAIESLSKAVQLDPTLSRELLPLIASSQLRLPKPDPTAALETINRFLVDKSVTVPHRWDGEIIRLRALIEASQYKTFDELQEEIRTRKRTKNANLEGDETEFRHQAELLASIRRINQAIAQYGPTVSSPSEDRTAARSELDPVIYALGQLQREASPRIAAQARLWQARAMMAVGDEDDALTQLTAVRQQRPFAAEAIVGGLEEIEWLASRGRGVEVLQTARYLVRELGDESGFDASLVSFAEFQRRVIEAIQSLRQTGAYAETIDTSRALPPLFPLSDSLTQEGISYQQWANATMDEGTNVTGDVSRTASILARSRYRAAGDAFAEAAKLKFDEEEFVSAQWSAIDAYQEGRHFRRSIQLLKDYLRYEQRGRLPRGLVAYGRALLAEGETEKALDALGTCIVEYPRDPLRYDARLIAAMALIEKDQTADAEQFLIENLEDGELTPQSPAWRDSLFTLGELYYDRAYRNHLAQEQSDNVGAAQAANQPILEKAIRYLDESVQRYWPSPRSETAAYLSARAHVMASRWPRAESQSPDILEAARRSLRAQSDQELKIAKDGFVSLKRHLMTREDEARLPAKQKAILRNCFMAEAETLREMENLEDAAEAYRTVELRYMNEPLALEAILNRSACARELGRKEEADLLVRQADVVLRRIPAKWNARFEEMTRFDRNGWQQYLTWMTSRIAAGDA